MAKSLTEIAQSVRAEQAVSEKLGGMPEGGLPTEALHFEQTWTGELRDIDDLVIGVGDDLTFRYAEPEYPLTDLYRFCQLLLNTFPVLLQHASKSGEQNHAA